MNLYTVKENKVWRFDEYGEMEPTVAPLPTTSARYYVLVFGELVPVENNAARVVDDMLATIRERRAAELKATDKNETMLIVTVVTGLAALGVVVVASIFASDREDRCGKTLDNVYLQGAIHGSLAAIKMFGESKTS